MQLAGEIDPLALANDGLRILSERMDTAPEDIPSGALMRLAEQLAKLEMARLQNKPPEDKRVDATVAEILTLDGLPVERRRELLIEARRKAWADVQQIDAALADFPDAEGEG